ncbi:UDP-N-acetylmuramoyl-tripeptide--D-alanyl-D-alanine ligase [Ligilactobacillus equi]|nr:UDP-N-acetylmuramoyl-tripeptide--D-alanyl-D-alanine ligase [Ligilactobacillus equi]
MRMQLSEVAQALDFPIAEGFDQVEITSVSFDSRSLEPGALFIPLVGENDGHSYIQSAIDHGAVATLWQADHADLPTLPAIVVEDSLQALQKLAKYYLMKINPKVVAVTGSNGKTTTKDMTAAILATTFNVQKTFANFNNEIGVPMTLLAMEPNTEVVVVEMGMDHPGELDALSKLVEPDVAVITMIGEAHIEFFKERGKIADAKMEITHGLKEDGVLIYNGDEPLLRERTQNLIQETRTFGLAENDELYAQDIVSDAQTTNFRVANFDQVLTIPMLGAYNVNNALAAISVGLLYQIESSQIMAALKNFQVTENRTQWVSGQDGLRILSDVYNSNPTAAKEVLAAFSQVPTDGRRIAVLGDMLELGDDAPEMHASLAEKIVGDKLAVVYLYGSLMANLAQKLRDQGYTGQIHHYPKEEQTKLIADLQQDVTGKDIVMLKASHGMHLENVLTALKA